MENPLGLEEDLYDKGYSPVGGVDEAGRGPLAGPVVACAVIFPRNLVIEGVNDSKKITGKRRNELAKIIKERAIAYCVGFVDAETIDKVNILQATLLAMKCAADNLAIKPAALIIDGTHAPKLTGIHCVCVPKGDALSHACAAASIIAKTERDAFMENLHLQYPMYGFDIHKGYGTKTHIEAIRANGYCPQHRMSFKVKGLT